MSVGAAMIDSRVDDALVRAMVLDAPGRPLRPADDLDDPEPGPGEALVAVHACGVCRTDLHIVDGELDVRRRPLVPGHQIVGTVLAAGAERARDVSAKTLKRVYDRLGFLQQRP